MPAACPQHRPRCGRQDRSATLERGESPAAPNRCAVGGPIPPVRDVGETSTSGRCYQGIPLRSGMFAVDCSGKPPDMRIRAIISTPVHPPPTNATINHQAETIPAPISHGLANARPSCRALATRTFAGCSPTQWPRVYFFAARGRRNIPVF